MTGWADLQAGRALHRPASHRSNRCVGAPLAAAAGPGGTTTGKVTCQFV